MDGATPTDTGTTREESEPTLAQRVQASLDRRRTGLPILTVSRAVSDVAMELDALHGQGKTHGDVQASQIAVPYRGPARLLGGPVTRSAGSIDGDVRGLVTAAYLALTGVSPSHFHPLSSPTDSAPTGPEAPFAFLPNLHPTALPPAVSDVFVKGLSPQQSERYASAGEFAAALAAASGQIRLAPSRRRLLLSCVVAACALMALLGWLGHGRTVLPASSPPAAPGSTPSAPTLPAPLLIPAPRRSESGPASPAVTLPVPPPGTTLPPGPVLPPFPLPAPAAPPDQLVAVTPEALHPGRHGSGAYRPKFTAPGAILRVYARQFITAQDVQERRISDVPARRVLVDGNQSRSLAAGRWTSLPSGSHKLAFYPAPGVPFDPNTKFWIRLRPGRRAVQIPLPRHPGGVQGGGQTSGG